MESKSKFLKVVCPRCRQRHVVFGKSSLRIKCKKCNYLLTQPGGGKTRIRAIVEAILWR